MKKAPKAPIKAPKAPKAPQRAKKRHGSMFLFFFRNNCHIIFLPGARGSLHTIQTEGRAGGEGGGGGAQAGACAACAFAGDDSRVRPAGTARHPQRRRRWCAAGRGRWPASRHACSRARRLRDGRPQPAPASRILLAGIPANAGRGDVSGPLIPAPAPAPGKRDGEVGPENRKEAR